MYIKVFLILSLLYDSNGRDFDFDFVFKCEPSGKKDFYTPDLISWQWF